MQKSIKFFFYMAMVSLACLLSGITLTALDRHFPSSTGPFPGPGGTEFFRGSAEGLTLTKIGVLGFLLSSVVCLVLTIIEKIRKPGSSA